VIRHRSLLHLLLLFLCLECSSGLAHAVVVSQDVDPVEAKLGKGFISTTARVNGTALHYVRGGTGTALILIHGFPENWSAYHKVMPRLAKNFTALAIDLRGIGKSQATPRGYDAANLAEDVYQLIDQLKLKPVYVVGHDVGGMFAYALTRRYPQTVRGAMLLESPLPGLKPWGDLKADPQLWHFGFHQTPNLAEKLLEGRQFLYFREHYFSFNGIKNPAISDADVANYANAYKTPEQLRAGMEFYRAFPANEKFNAAERTLLEVPFVLVGGEYVFAKLLPNLAEDMLAHGCKRVAIETIKNGGHYLVDEQPEKISELIERYALSGKNLN
jgi:pimeloyl-ACP methyl ester carboxylesterase